MSVADPVLTSILWLVVVGSLGAFLFGYGTGSNDVANAFGTSVGSKTLTLRKAVVLAAVFEFSGAMLLGRVSTATIAGGIASITAFQREPEVYAYGMVIALIVSGVWQIVASYYELNVSSTHSIIGSILGFALVYGGQNAVRWADPDPTAFPPYKGVVPIIVSWFISPIATGLVAAGLFVTIRTLMLRRSNAYALSFWMLPFLVLVTVFVSIFFVFTKGARKALSSDEWSNARSAWVSIVVASGIAILTGAIVLPILHHRATARFDTTHIEVSVAVPPAQDVEMASKPERKLHPSSSMSVSPSNSAGTTSSGRSVEEPEQHPRGDSPTILEGSVALFSEPQVTPQRQASLARRSDSLLEGRVEHHVMNRDERDAAVRAAVAHALERRRHKEEDKRRRREEEEARATATRLGLAPSTTSSESESIWGGWATWTRNTTVTVLSKIKLMLLHGTEVDIHEVVEDDPIIAAIHANAEKFEPKVEFAFSYLQVFSAICVIFAHGAGEVGYMAGPLATIWQAYTEGKLTGTVRAPVWVILICAAGLVLGLATYGYKVTRAMGVRLSKLSPTRGFCAELATALTILICSQYGLPTSSSQCITGGIIGVGTLEGRLGVNWRFFARQVGSWVATLFVSGIFTAALFAQGLYAPSKVSGAAQVYYEDHVTGLAAHLYTDLQSQLLPYQAAAIAGALPRLSGQQFTALNSTLTDKAAAAKQLASTQVQTVSPSTVMSSLYQALQLYQGYTVVTVAQNKVYPGADNGVCNGPAGPSDPGVCKAPHLVP